TAPTLVDPHEVAEHVVVSFQAEGGIRAFPVTGVQTCALPIYPAAAACAPRNGCVTAAPWKPSASATRSSGSRSACGAARTNRNRSEERRAGEEARGRRHPAPREEKRGGRRRGGGQHRQQGKGH